VTRESVNRINFALGVAAAILFGTLMTPPQRRSPSSNRLYLPRQANPGLTSPCKKYPLSGDEGEETLAEEASRTHGTLLRRKSDNESTMGRWERKKASLDAEVPRKGPKHFLLSSGRSSRTLSADSNTVLPAADRYWHRYGRWLDLLLCAMKWTAAAWVSAVHTLLFANFGLVWCTDLRSVEEIYTFNVKRM